MAEPRQPPAHDDAAAESAGPWTEEEKRRGAPTDAPPGTDAGAAGDAVPKGGYGGDDRAETESAAARTGAEAEAEAEGAPNRPAPGPDTPVVGGPGRGAIADTAIKPGAEDPQAPRNPL